MSKQKAEVPLFNTYDQGQLTIEEARRHRDALNRQIDDLVNFGEKYYSDPELFDPLQKKFKLFAQQERAYRKYTRSLFTSSKPNYPHSPPRTQQPLNPTKPTSNHPIHHTTDIPDIPDNNTQSHSIVNYHSDEEKCENLPSLTKKGPPRTRISPPNTIAMRPKSQDTRPYIDDESGLKAAYNRVALLLFNEWPHPVNSSQLHVKHWDYYRQTLDLQTETIEQYNNGYITTKENPFGPSFDNNWDEQSVFYNLADISRFFDDSSRFINDSSKDKQREFELIRNKVNRHFNDYHPQGLKRIELEKVFKYWIWSHSLMPKLQKDLVEFLFDEYYDNNERHVIIKGKPKPDLPLKEPWKVYGLSPKHIILCVLSDSVLSDRGPRTMDQFKEEYRNYFAVSFDVTSPHNQAILIKLIDHKLFSNKRLLLLSQESQKKHQDWMNWWSINGPNTRNTPHQQQQQQHSSFGSNGGNEQKQSFSEIARDRYNENQDQNEYSRNNNQHNHDTKQYPQRYDTKQRYDYGDQNNSVTRYTHPQECLLFIGGFSLKFNETSEVLKLIEEEYAIKFNNFRPAYFKKFESSQALCPIPVQNVDMAQKLIRINRLTLKDYPDMRLNARPYLVSKRDSRGYNDHYNSGYNRSGYNQQSQYNSSNDANNGGGYNRGYSRGRGHRNQQRRNFQ